MLIGHLPAGYIASSFVLDQVRASAKAKRRLLIVGLVCSVLPDLDTLYFYLVDSSRHHHAFVTHWPSFWVALTGVGLLTSYLRRDRLLRVGALLGGMNALLHLALDSIAGQVYWLKPFSERHLTLVEIPARYDSWVVSFLLHWTFGVEVALVVVAVVLFAWRRKRGKKESVGVRAA